MRTQHFPNVRNVYLFLSRNETKLIYLCFSAVLIRFGGYLNQFEDSFSLLKIFGQHILFPKSE